MDNKVRRQDHFNKAYLGVIAQGEPAMDKGTGRCQYLSASGSKCAVGHILTEEELAKWGDFKGGVGDLCWEKIKSNNHPFFFDKDFYMDLQDLHDYLVFEGGAEFVSMFKQDMRLLATRYNLEVPDETATA